MTFLEILRYVYRRAGHADTPTTAVADRIKQYVNARQRDILTAEGMDKLRRQTLTFASDTSNATYALPQDVVRVVAISERDNDYPLDMMTIEEYRLYSADPTGYEGTPAWYVPLGESPVANQPTSNKEISFKSDAASDTLATATVELVQANNYRRTITTPKLNGTTAVSADTSITDVSHVTNFSLSDTAAGFVTLHFAGDTTVDGGGELAKIAPGQTRARYFQVALVPKPSSAITYYVDADVDVADMTVNTDEPRLPRDFHHILAEGALADELMKQEKSREARISEGRFADGVRRLREFVTNERDYVPYIGRTRRRAISRLGPNYPADYYPFS